MSEFLSDYIKIDSKTEGNFLNALDIQIGYPEADLFDDPEDWGEYDAILIVRGLRIVGSTGFCEHADLTEELEIGESGSVLGTLYIVATGILPEFRDQKIASEAKRWQIQYARVRGFKRIVSYPRKSSAAILALNEKFGFKRVREISGLYEDEPAVAMELVLD